MTLTEKRAKILATMAGTTDIEQLEKLSGYLSKIDGALTKPKKSKIAEQLSLSLGILALFPAVPWVFTSAGILAALLIWVAAWVGSLIACKVAILVIAAGVECGSPQNRE